MDVKNETPHNTPIVIDEKVISSGITLIALWDTNADSSYKVHWPEDKKLPLLPNSVIAVFTRQGVGEILLHTGEIVVVRGPSVIFLQPTSIKSYYCVGLIWEMFWMEFTPNGALEFPYGEIISWTEGRDFSQECLLAVKLLSETDHRKKVLGAAIIIKIIYEWLTLTDFDAVNSGTFDKVQRVLTEIHLNISKNWSIGELAEIAQCSEQYLRRLFIRYTRQSPKNYCLTAKLNIAHSLLKQKKLSVQQVSDRLGFYDSFHLSKAFKKKFGYPPSSLSSLL
ncbi:AraC family transcriptional regulator [Parasalinivibrio latis]|uniref:helix-turn-helix domain-containing protein n=1 Tax=Parasalinivibrio latis TaxID=2952610 RepID=UPI0030E5D797